MECFSKVKAVATDLDGTLTIDRKSYHMPLEVIDAVRALSSVGVKVIIVTANCFPISIGLARYLGFTGVVCENGCIISTVAEPLKNTPHSLTTSSARELTRRVASKLKGLVRESWQNEFRKHDFALVTSDKSRHKEAIKQILDLMSSSEKERFRVSSSGYAIHITPIECSKLNGLKKLLSILGVTIEETLGIGDSCIDKEFVTACSLSVAVSNADEELKNDVDIVTKEPSGYGFAEIAREIVKAKKRGVKQ